MENTETKKSRIRGNYKKDLVFQTQYVVDNDKKYAHPRIDFYELGTEYPEGIYSSSAIFSFEYQVTLINDDGKPNDNRYAYAGRIEYCHIRDIPMANKIFTATEKKIQELDIHGDVYQQMLTALKAAGYRECVRDYPYITAILK